MTEYTFVLTVSSKKEWTFTTRASSLAEAEGQAVLHAQFFGPPSDAVETGRDYEAMAVDRIPPHLS